MAFRLGETVTVNRALRRTYEERRVPSPYNSERIVTQHWRVWKPSPLKPLLADVDTVVGLVMGTRTLMNIERMWLGYEEGWDNNLGTAERFQAVLVAYDLRRKPLWVLPEDAHQMPEG